MESISKNKVCLKGVIGIPEVGWGGELMGYNTSLRRKLDLYANVVKVRSLPGVKSRHKNIDAVIIRYVLINWGRFQKITKIQS